MSLFQLIAHPLLRSVDPKLAFKLLEKRSRYEENVNAKKNDHPSQRTEVAYQGPPVHAV